MCVWLYLQDGEYQSDADFSSMLMYRCKGFLLTFFSRKCWSALLEKIEMLNVTILIDWVKFLSLASVTLLWETWSLSIVIWRVLFDFILSPEVSSLPKRVHYQRWTWTMKYSPVDFWGGYISYKTWCYKHFEMQILKRLSKTANGLSADDAKQMASVSSAVELLRAVVVVVKK